MVFDPGTAPQQQVCDIAAGDRVRFDSDTGIVAVRFPDGVCHVRVDGTNRMVAAYVSSLTIDSSLPSRTLRSFDSDSAE
jgi:hypothetical protein